MSSGQTVKAFEVPGGRLVRLETDLPFETLVKVADDHGLNWLFLVSTPEMGTGKALIPLYKACCEVAGVDLPEKITARSILNALQDVPDDLPEYYEDGNPKADESTTP